MRNSILFIVVANLLLGCNSASTTGKNSNVQPAADSAARISFAPSDRKPVTLDSPDQLQASQNAAPQEIDMNQIDRLVALDVPKNKETASRPANDFLWSHLKPIALEPQSKINGLLAAAIIEKASTLPGPSTGSSPAGFPGSGNFPGSFNVLPGGKTNEPISVQALKSLGAYQMSSQVVDSKYWPSQDWAAMEPDVAEPLSVELKKWLPIEAGYPPTFAAMNCSSGVWINAWPATSSGEVPYEYDRSGKNAKPRKLKKGEKPQLDSNGQPMTYSPVKDKPKLGYNTLDLLNQKSLGQYNWKAPIDSWPALSPDGKKMVGMCPYSRWRLDSKMDIQHPPSDKCLSIFSLGKNEVDGWIELADSPRWIGFVDSNVLAIYNREPDGLVQFWDVQTNKMLRSVPLPTAFRKGPGDESAFLGTVSANGKYLALGTSHGIVLIESSSGSVLNMLAIPMVDSHLYTGLNFSRDGRFLYSIIGKTLIRWSLQTGLPELVIRGIEQSGPILDGPIPGTLVLGNKRFATRLGSLSSGSPIAGATPPNSAVIETISGSPITSLPYHVLHDYGQGRWLVIADSNYVKEETTKPRTASLFPDDPIRYIGLVSSDSVDTKTFETSAQMGFAQVRPMAPMLKSDAAKVLKLTKPEASVDVPHRESKAVELGSDKAVLPTYAAWPVAFADKVAAILHFKLVVTNQGSRREVLVQRVDVQTGTPMGEPVRLWAWASPKEYSIDGVPGNFV
jgi:hypothetical protein